MFVLFGSKRVYAIVTLYAYSGLRRTECVGLLLEQVDLVSKEIRVVGKGDKQRLVYINDKIVHAIREYLKERRSESPYLSVFGSYHTENAAALFPRATSHADVLARPFGDCRGAVGK